MSTPIDDIRFEMSEVLKSDTLDIDKIIELSNKLARADTEHVRFSTDAGIISRLGRELVAKQETALAELIKNSYDADSTDVKLTFDNALKSGGVLIIEDNGMGMTRDQLVNGFMRLSSPDKLENPISQIYKRRRAGRKGIGRFAVQRLGTSLTIITQTRKNDLALKIEIDWNAFINGIDLISVANRIITVPKEREEGTVLVINNLFEGWSDVDIRRTYRYVTDLIQPFPLNGHEIIYNDNEKVDPGYNVTVYRIQNGRERIVADEQHSVYSSAIAVVESSVDNDGNGFCTINSTRFDLINERIKIEKNSDNYATFTLLKNIKLRAYYFIWQPNLYPRSIYKLLRDLAQEKAGIRVYRNGFRVRPYGERKDDWLGLDASTAARDILPPHANINFFGFVELLDIEGVLFNETSSREGLIENEAFKELQDFVSKSLKASVLRIAEVRGRKQTKTQRDWEKDKKDPNLVIKNAAERLKSVLKQSQKNAFEKDNKIDDVLESNKLALNNHFVFKETDRLLNEILEATESNIQKDQTLLHELGMLRVLSSLGLIIGEFTHEVRQVLGAAEIDAKKLVEKLGLENKEYKRVVRLESNIKRFTTHAAYFDKAVRENISRELVPQNLKNVVEDFVNTVSPTALQLGIQIVQESTEIDSVTLPMHGSELASILFNFYSNSQKATRRTCNDGHIHIRTGADSKKVFLEFADNGDGILTQHNERIFDAFFTTSTPVGLEGTNDEEMQGTGLGLKIVKDIVEGYGGEVYISQAPVNFTTCFRVELPLNSDER